MRRWTVMAGGMVVATVALAFGDSTPVVARARGRWQDLLTPASSHGGGRDHRGARDASTTTSAAVPVPDMAPVPSSLRTTGMLAHNAADRMREALAVAQDDPKSAGKSAEKISRLISQAAAEARRNNALGDRVWYWRDPFSENPRQPIVLSLEAQLDMQIAAARQEAARARIESAAARVEAATAHAEAARARAEAARAQAMLTGGHTMVAKQQGRVTPSTRRRMPTPPATVAPAAGTLPTATPGRQRAVRRTYLPRTALAHNAQTGDREDRHRDIGARTETSTETPAAVAVQHDADTATPAVAPATWRSHDPRGIVVVPIGGGGNADAVASLPRQR